MTEVTIRQANHADSFALVRLAALDSARMPNGALLVAEADGELVAALPLGGGAGIADPFRPTAHAMRLLELRVRQLSRAGRPARNGWRRRQHRRFRLHRA